MILLINIILIVAGSGFALFLPKIYRRHGRWNGGETHFLKFVILVGQILFILAGTIGVFEVLATTKMIPFELHKQADRLLRPLLPPLLLLFLTLNCALEWLSPLKRKQAPATDGVPDKPSE